MLNRGIIFDIQRFAVHDGPGIRTTVFLKGCQARCGWCHNPESLSLLPQIQYYQDRCNNCGRCFNLCSNGAHKIDTEAKHQFNRNLCKTCGLCAEECLNDALVISGKKMTVDEVLKKVLDDSAYYIESGGGVTLSGGEPVLQGDFCESLLKRLKSEKIHTNLQTAGFYPYHMLKRLLPYLDLVTYDIKGVSHNIYDEHICADSSLAFENLNHLDEYGIPIAVRTPCIHGINDSPQEIESIAIRISALKNLQGYKLIPYHNLAKIKYDILGQEFYEYKIPAREHLELLKKIAEKYVKVII